jgi:hypothetical protein
MPKLTPQDWKILRNNHKVAFREMPTRLFNLLLEKVYSRERKSTKLDSVDALLIHLAGGKARTEPPLPLPGPKAKRR